MTKVFCFFAALHVFAIREPLIDVLLLYIVVFKEFK